MWRSPRRYLVLSPSKVTLYTRRSGGWEFRRDVPLAPGKRGRATSAAGCGNRREFSGVSAGLRVWRPVEPSLSMDCRAATHPGNWNRAAEPRCWPISPLHAITSMGAWPPGRFAKTVARSIPRRPRGSPVRGERNRLLWLLAMLDGRTQVFDAQLDPVGAIGSWAATSPVRKRVARWFAGARHAARRCGRPDAIQAFAIVNGAARHSPRRWSSPGR